MTEIERIIARSVNEARAQGFYEGHVKGWKDGGWAMREFIMNGDPDKPHSKPANPLGEHEPQDAARAALKDAYPGVVLTAEHDGVGF